eukprot:5486251-Pleurochrysis_carterae.AAC.11
MHVYVAEGGAQILYGVAKKIDFIHMRRTPVSEGYVKATNVCCMHVEALQAARLRLPAQSIHKDGREQVETCFPGRLVRVGHSCATLP